MQLLAAGAQFIVYAFHLEGRFLLLPTTECEFETVVRDAMKKGATPVAVIALMNRVTPEGQALIEWEQFPGASEEHARNAAAVFKANLLEAGIIRLTDTDTNASDC
jgi:hypothetical protein